MHSEYQKVIENESIKALAFSAIKKLEKLNSINKKISNETINSISN